MPTTGVMTEARSLEPIEETISSNTSQPSDSPYKKPSATTVESAEAEVGDGGDGGVSGSCDIAGVDAVGEMKVIPSASPIVSHQDGEAAGEADGEGEGDGNDGDLGQLTPVRLVEAVGAPGEGQGQGQGQGSNDLNASPLSLSLLPSPRCSQRSLPTTPATMRTGPTPSRRRSILPVMRTRRRWGRRRQGW